jgi:hypothetical protein
LAAIARFRSIQRILAIVSAYCADDGGLPVHLR